MVAVTVAVATEAAATAATKTGPQKGAVHNIRGGRRQRGAGLFFSAAGRAVRLYSGNLTVGSIDVSFLSRLFSRKAKQPYEPMRGIGKLQTDEEQERIRTKMEGEMSAERNRREDEKKPD